MAVSSSPAAATTSSVGASATAFTVTSSVFDTSAVSVPSVVVAVTVSWKSTSELAAGVTVRPSSWSGDRVQVPSPLSVPADRLAPAGTPEIVTLRTSEPSWSVRPEVIFSAMAVSSSPAAAATSSVGASASGATDTNIEPVVVAWVTAPVSGSVSVEVTATVRVKSASESSAGVTVRPSNWSADRVQVPSSFFVPADRVAPSGTPEIVTLRTSEESVSAASIASGIAWSSVPAASETVKVGASAWAVTMIGTSTGSDVA